MIDSGFVQIDNNNVTSYTNSHDQDFYQKATKMSIQNRKKRKIRPPHPGEILREDFLPDYDLSVSAFARAIGVSRQSVNELLRERRAVSPGMALRLSRIFGNTPEFWLNAQQAVDLWEAARNMEIEIRNISTLNVA